MWGFQKWLTLTYRYAVMLTELQIQIDEYGFSTSGCTATSVTSVAPPTVGELTLRVASWPLLIKYCLIALRALIQVISQFTGH